MAADWTAGPFALSLAPAEMPLAHNLEVNGLAYALVVLDPAGNPLVTFDPPFEVVMPLPVGVDPASSRSGRRPEQWRVCHAGADDQR